MKITIDPAIKRLLRPLSEQELSTLHASLEREGIRDPLAIWKRGSDNVLLDGHHRHAWATKRGKGFVTIEIKGISDLTAALDWVARNQMARRSLTDSERDQLLARHYAEVKQAHGGARKSSGAKSSCHDDNLMRSADHVAEAHGVSPRTVTRAVETSENIESVAEESQPAADAIVSGEVASTRRDIGELASLSGPALKTATKAIAGGEVKSVAEAVAKAGGKRRAKLTGDAARWSAIRRSIRACAGALLAAQVMDGASPYEVHPERIEKLMRAAWKAGAEKDMSTATGSCRQVAEAVKAIGSLGATLAKEFLSESTDRKAKARKARKARKSKR